MPDDVEPGASVLEEKPRPTKSDEASPSVWSSVWQEVTGPSLDPYRDPDAITYTLAYQLSITLPALALLLTLVLYRQNRPLDPDVCQPRALDRGFIGNSDFYGLGIRLGIYLQWLCMSLAQWRPGRDTRFLYASSAGLMAAMSIALLTLVFGRRCTYTAEVVVILHLLIVGGLLVSAHTLVEFRGETKFSLKWSEFRGMRLSNWPVVVLTFPVLLWFWFRMAIVGEADYYATPGGTSLFFAADFRGQSVRHLSAAFAFISVCAAHTYFIALWLSMVLVRMRRRVLGAMVQIFSFDMAVAVLTAGPMIAVQICTRWSVIWLYRTVRHFSPTAADVIDRNTRPLFLISTPFIFMGAGLVMLVWSIVAVELTLKWNHVSGVNEVASTGQLIPLVTGLMSVMATIWQIVFVTPREQEYETSHALFGGYLQHADGTWR